MSEQSAIIETLQEAKDYINQYRDIESGLYKDVWEAQKFRSGFDLIRAKITVEANEITMMIPDINREINEGINDALDDMKRRGFNSTEAQKRLKGELSELYHGADTVECVLKNAKSTIDALKGLSDSLSSLIKLMESDLHAGRQHSKEDVNQKLPASFSKQEV